MSGRHGARAHGLYVPKATPVHRLGAPAKLLGLVVFVVVVASTDPRRPALFAVDAVIVACVAGVARLPVPLVLRRIAAIVPFVAFALLLPIIGTGARVDVMGVSLSVDGLWSAFGIIAKALLGATAAVVVTATTPVPVLLDGLARLRVPATLVAVTAFAIRYVDVVADELAGMRRAMVARGHDPRWLFQVGPIASSIGVLFVRSYERGERIHGAMLARGFDGTLPATTRERPVLRGQWVALGPGAVALGTVVLTVVAAR